MLFCISCTGEHDLQKEEPKDYSGFAYVKGLDKNGASLMFSVLSEKPQTVSAVLRCRVTGDEATAAITVNTNGKTSDMAIPAGPEWQDIGLELALDEGVNSITLYCGNPGPNDIHIDYLELN